MKDIGWHAMAVALCAGCLMLNAGMSNAEFPSPKPRPAVQAQAPTPAPQAEPAYIPASPVVNVPAPQVTVQAAPSNDFFNYIWTGLASVFTVLFGKLALFPSGTKLTPETRAMLDQAAIAAVQTGLPGKAIVAGAGLIPGVGGLAGLGEPALRQLVLEGLQARLAQNQGGVVPALSGTIMPPAAIQAPQLDNLAALAEMVADKIKARIGFPSPGGQS